MGFYTNRQFCARCMTMAVLWFAYTSSLLSFTLSRECIYINVCLVMVVAVRAGHVILKFKFMVIDFNFIQSIQLYRPNL